jgi:hypothetical protein
MPLPKLQHPIYELQLPSTGQSVKFRPFLVREEKILLMAKQSEDPKETINAIKQIINNCTVDSQLDVDHLSTFDIEYFFLKLRSKSVNNIVSLSYRDFEDEKVYTVDVNLDDVQIKRDPTHSDNIKINESVGLMMKYPSAEVYGKIASNEGDELALGAIKACIESVYDEENVYPIKDFSDKEVDEFLQSLNVGALEKVLNFFRTMPKLHYELKYVNSLGNTRTVELNTLSDFFTLG